MKKKFTAVINKEDKWYVAHCVELDVVSQGKTIEDAQANLKEAVELYLESFETEDYAGSIKLSADPVKYQRSLRNEWE